MEHNLSRTLHEFRKGRREGSEYQIFRAIHMRLTDMAASAFPQQNHKGSLVEDLENVAIKRATEKYGWFKDDYIWKRPHKGRRTYVRYDLARNFELIIREDRFLRNFLINAELLTMIDEYNTNRKAFWEMVEDEIRECCEREIR